MPDPTLYFYFLPAVKVHLVQNTSSLAQFCFLSNPIRTLLWCFMPYYWRARHKDRSQFAKKIHAMTDKWKYSVFTKPSYKWFIFVTKILLASSATTFAHRRTSSSNTYWLIPLCCYPNVNGAIRNLSLNNPTATIFLQFNYFRENIWVRIWVQFHFLYIFVGRVDRIR